MGKKNILLDMITAEDGGLATSQDEKTAQENSFLNKDRAVLSKITLIFNLSPCLSSVKMKRFQIHIPISIFTNVIKVKVLKHKNNISLSYVFRVTLFCVQ